MSGIFSGPWPRLVGLDGHPSTRLQNHPCTGALPIGHSKAESGETSEAKHGDRMHGTRRSPTPSGAVMGDWENLGPGVRSFQAIRGKAIRPNILEAEECRDAPHTQHQQRSARRHRGGDRPIRSRPTRSRRTLQSEKRLHRESSVRWSVRRCRDRWVNLGFKWEIERSDGEG